MFGRRSKVQSIPGSGVVVVGGEWGWLQHSGGRILRGHLSPDGGVQLWCPQKVIFTKPGLSRVAAVDREIEL